MSDSGEAVQSGEQEASEDSSLVGRSRSPQGLRFIASWEGFRGHLYDDPLHCTIGYGHLVHHGKCNGSEPARFKRGITQQEGLELLREDVREFERCVGSGVKVSLTQSQFDALVSFSFNVGCGAFQSSTLLRRLNRGEYRSVPDELLRWVKDSNGKTLPGLVRRRRAEGALFRDGKYAELDEIDEEAGQEAHDH